MKNPSGEKLGKCRFGKTIARGKKLFGRQATRSYFFVQSKVVGFNTFLPCLSIGRSVLRTSTNELQSSHTKQSARGAAVVNYWVRSNNSNSGDFPEARANRVILKSAAIT